MRDAEDVLLRPADMVGGHPKCVLAGINTQAGKTAQILSLRVISERLLKFGEVDHAAPLGRSKIEVKGREQRTQLENFSPLSKRIAPLGSFLGSLGLEERFSLKSKAP